MVTDVVSNILNKWLILKEKNISTAYILKELNYKNIAIFGKNDLAERLYSDIETKFSKVDIILDKNMLQNYNCIIIADFQNYYDLEKQMLKNADIYSVREIVELTYFLFIDVRKISNLNKNTKKFIVRVPKIDVEYKSKNIYEAMVSLIKFNRENFDNNPSFFKYLYNDIAEFSDEYIKQLFQTPAIIVKESGEATHIDYKSDYLNVINSERYTPNQAEEYYNKIYIFGDCYAFGTGADDNRTIASHIQNYFKESRVINYGMLGAGGEDRCFNRPSFYNYEDNDIIIIFALYPYLPLSSKKKVFDFISKELNEIGITYCDMMKVYDNRNENKPIFFDASHVNHRGYKLIADYLYNNYLSKIEINKTGKKKNSAVKNITSKLSQEHNKGLEEYLKYLSTEKFKNSDNKKCGSIVMNVNPFTYGHKYLIEQALKEVDYLYIFLVEENKSIFSLDDRYNIITANLKDYKNIKVLKSGKYIISTITFPEYFTKDFQKEVAVDTSLDISIFAEKIAPALNISVRFAGNEPFCNITRQYNNTMQEILPQYNIEFKVIQRYEIDGMAVSATTVRKCIDNKDYDSLKKLVPKATYDYLKNKFMV